MAIGDKLVNLDALKAVHDADAANVADLKSHLNAIEDVEPLVFFNQTVSGTTSVVANCNIPAGTYTVACDGITSEDTTNTKSNVRFGYSSGNKTISFDRTASSHEIEFTADVVSMIFYASTGNDPSQGKAFTFSNFTISQKSDIVEKIESLEANVTGLNTNLNNSIYVQNAEQTAGAGVSGYWSDGEFTSDTQIKGRKITVGDAVKVRISGYMAQYYDRYDFLDSENNVIGYDRKTTSGGNEDITVDIPRGAYYVCVSNGSANDVANKKVYLIRYVNDSLEDALEDISDLQTLSDMEISGYTKSEWLDVTGTAGIVSGKYAEMNNGKVVISNGNYQYAVLSVTPGEVYKTTGMNYFDMRPAIYTDDDENILSYSPETRVTTAAYITVETTAPVGATKLYVDSDPGTSIVIKKKGVFFVEDDSTSMKISVAINDAVETDTTIITKRNGIFRHKLGVFNASGQPNGAVLPRSVEVYMSDSWKTIVNNEDDNCPVDLGSGYIGAGHGYGRAYKLTLTSHGKTYADIGSKWVTNATYARNYYIVRIIDENNLVVLGAADTANDYDTTNYWGNSDSLIHVEGATHTDTMTGYTKAQYLLVPIDKNHVKKIMLDGIVEVSENGEYEADSFVDIIDEYDVVNPQGIITEIVANKPSGGYTENPAVNTGTVFLHFSNVYRILSDGTMLVITTLDNDLAVSLTYWGGTQYAQKASENGFGGACFRYVPKLLPVTVNGSAKDLRTPFNLSNWNFTLDELTASWENPNSPPDRLLHLYTNGSSKYVAGFAVGYIPVGFGDPNVRKNNVGNAMNLYSTKKAYFHLIDNSGQDSGSWAAYTPYQSIIYRKPVIDVANNHTDAYFIPLGDVCYLYADYHAVADDRIKVPAEYVGKPMTVVEKSDNVTVYGTIATDEIRIRCASASPMYGYAVVKIGE